MKGFLQLQQKTDSTTAYGSIWFLAVLSLILLIATMALKSVSQSEMWILRISIVACYFGGLSLCFRIRRHVSANTWITHVPYLLGPILHFAFTLYRLGVLRLK